MRQQNNGSECLLSEAADTCYCVKISEKASSFMVHHQMVYL